MGNAASSSLRGGLEAIRSAPMPEDEPAFDALVGKVIPSTAVDLSTVVAMLQPEDIRELIAERPRNLARLIVGATEIVASITSQPDVTQYPQLMNAVRILTRVLPIALEDPDFSHNLLVSSMLPDSAGVPAGAAAPAVPLGAPAADAAPDAAASTWSPVPNCAPGEIMRTLISGVCAAGFLPELTTSRAQYEMFIERLARAEAAGEAAAAAAGGAGEEAAPTPTVSNAVWPMLLWKGGITFPLLAPPGNPAWTSARCEVLRCLLTLSCETLYSTALPGQPLRSPFLDFMTSLDCDFAPTLFYCLLNTVTAYDPVGYGVPYATSFAADTEVPLVALSLQLLTVLLDYSPAAGRAVEIARVPLTRDAEGRDVPPEATPAEEGAPPPDYAQFNVYRSMLAGLSEEGDFEALFSSIVRALDSIQSAQTTLLRGAYAPFAPYPELLVLLWKALDENKAFRSHVTSSPDVNSLTVPLLYLLWTERSNATKVGLIHLATFILLLLSGERSFGVGINAPFPALYRAAFGPSLPLFEGTVTDLTIIVLQKLVVDGSPKLAGLYSCFLTIIANVSPYSKGLTLPASVKLVNLVELFAAPRFLFARPTNYAFVQQLLETINNLIQYQFDSNGVLVYTVVRRRAVFERLASLTPEGWLLDLAARSRKQAARMAVGRAAPAPAVEPAAEEGEEEGGEEEGEDGEAGEEVRSEVVSRLSHLAGGAEGGEGELQPPTGAGGAGAGAEARPGAPWQATEDWWSEARGALPLDTIMRCLGHLIPRLDALVQRTAGALDEEAVVEHIAATTLVGILPVPHPILMRQYAANAYTAAWFSTYIWGAIFMGMGRELPLFDAQAIRLFSVTLAP